MKNFILTVAALASFLLPLQAAKACSGELIEEYYTEIGARDIVGSTGRRLTSVASILIQDRANMHRLNRQDRADGYDECPGWFELSSASRLAR